MNLIQSYVAELPRVSKKDCEKIALYGGAAFAIISLANHSPRRGVIAAGAYTAALAVQYAVAPLFKRFEGDDGKLGVYNVNYFCRSATIIFAGCFPLRKCARA